MVLLQRRCRTGAWCWRGREGAPPGIKGVSLFLLPRVLPDGTRNRYRIVRLKEKLGTRSMASGEITLEGATAWMVGEPGAGLRQMADMVNNSRLSNGVRAAGMMRRAVTEALFIAHRRIAFGAPIVALPLMRRQLAKMLVRAEQARTMVFQTAEALRRSDAGEPGAYALLRILTPLLKFRACRDARVVTGDAMEVRGGCGYIEDFPDARLVRDAHLGVDLGRHVEHRRARRAARGGAGGIAGGAGGAPWRRCARNAGAAGALEAPTVRAFALARHAGGEGGPVLARQAATALYNVASRHGDGVGGARRARARARWRAMVLAPPRAAARPAGGRPTKRSRTRCCPTPALCADLDQRDLRRHAEAHRQRGGAEAAGDDQVAPVLAHMAPGVAVADSATGCAANSPAAAPGRHACARRR